MLRPIKFIPDNTTIDFVKFKSPAFIISIAAAVISIVSLAVQGLNFGIDFAGGLLIEVRAEQPVDIAAMRTNVGSLGLGDVQITSVGSEGRDVLIRVQRQPGDDAAQMAALGHVQGALGTGYEYRRTEVVGPKVGAELIEDGIWAVSLAILAIVVYIWFRFEWQFGIGALIATVHDVLITAGLFSLLQIEFNLTTVAALLTIAGYSINDTVVVFDRVRENLRKFKKMELPELLNQALNSTLSRTILTGGTTLLAVLCLLVLGGDVLRGFSIALLWGIVIGTYSSIYIATPVLLSFNLRSLGTEEEEAARP